VQQRTRELGIRMALGAETIHVVGVVLSTATRALVSGLGLGLVVAIAASRVLDGVLYGLSPLDPLTYVGVVAILLAAGLAATYLPTRRALRVDPTVALRYE
jgi:putative ABC transport system permease protein